MKPSAAASNSSACVRDAMREGALVKLTLGKPARARPDAREPLRAAGGAGSGAELRVRLAPHDEGRHEEPRGRGGAGPARAHDRLRFPRRPSLHHGAIAQLETGAGGAAAPGPGRGGQAAPPGPRPPEEPPDSARRPLAAGSRRHRRPGPAGRGHGGQVPPDREIRRASRPPPGGGAPAPRRPPSGLRHGLRQGLPHLRGERAPRRPRPGPRGRGKGGPG